MDVDIEKFEQRMIAELESTLLSLSQAAESAAIVELDQSSVGRLSRIDAIQQQEMAIGFKNRLLLRKRKLESALDRIASGKYGICCKCQDELEPDRLEADTATVFCTECASQREPN